MDETVVTFLLINKMLNKHFQYVVFTNIEVYVLVKTILLLILWQFIDYMRVYLHTLDTTFILIVKNSIISTLSSILKSRNYKAFIPIISKNSESKLWASVLSCLRLKSAHGVFNCNSHIGNWISSKIISGKLPPSTFQVKELILFRHMPA